MSYCRMGPHCDVYVIKSISGEWVCLAKNRGHGEFATRSAKDLFEHLVSHKSAGDLVPDRVFRRLKRDIEATR